MFLTRKNKNGGRRMRDFPIREQQGRLGYCLGYCDNCNEEILLALQEREEIMAVLRCSDETYKKLKKILTPKLSFTQILIKWIAKWINGKLVEMPIVDNFQYKN